MVVHTPRRPSSRRSPPRCAGNVGEFLCDELMPVWGMLLEKGLVGPQLEHESARDAGSDTLRHSTMRNSIRDVVHCRASGCGGGIAPQVLYQFTGLHCTTEQDNRVASMFLTQENSPMSPRMTGRKRRRPAATTDSDWSSTLTRLLGPYVLQRGGGWMVRRGACWTLPMFQNWQVLMATVMDPRSHGECRTFPTTPSPWPGSRVYNLVRF